MTQNEKKLTTILRLFIEQRLIEKGFTFLNDIYEFPINEDSTRYEYKLKEGTFTFTIEYINHELVYTINEYPGITNLELLPKHIKTEEFQLQITNLKNI
jgi:hypothetical protein